MIGIYKFTNKFNRKVYIGKSTNITERYKTHLRNAKNNHDGYFYNALRKYGPEVFDFEVLIELPWLKGADKKTIKKVLDYWETFYIKYYNANTHDYGYNETKGGEGHSGEAWNKGLSKETDARVLNISLKCGKPRYGKDNPFYGHHHTEESNELNRQKHTNKKQSKETIEKRLNNPGFIESINNRKPLNDEQRKNVSIGTTLAMHDPVIYERFLNAVREANRKKIGSKYMNNGIIRKLVRPEEWNEYKKLGFEFGRKICATN